MVIESEKVNVPHSSVGLLEWLEDLNNNQVLFPADRISDWESDKSNLKFRIQGTITISMVKKAAAKELTIHLDSGEDSPFPFTLDINLKDAASSTEVQLIFDGEVNSMLKMLIERPMTNLFNHMAEQMMEISL